MSKAKIHYYDIGDYLSREDKLRIIKQFGSVENIPWTILEPNEHGDWINHRNEMFKDFIPLGDKDDKKNKRTFFVPYYSNGLKTQRDPWCYNSSINTVKENREDLPKKYSVNRVLSIKTSRLSILHLIYLQKIYICVHNA